jgi:uncharacterized membrane protein (UPF0127 family)
MNANHSRTVRRSAFFGVLCAALACPVPSAAAENGAKATQPCANPALPAAILRGAAAAPSGPELRTIVVHAKHEYLRLAVVDTPDQRTLGLMCVTALRPRSGMLFVFADESHQTFWMKHTLIPLDMIWVRAGGRIDTVAARVPASTLQTPDADVARRGGEGTYVIELAAGEARRAGLTPGSTLALPSLHADS